MKASELMKQLQDKIDEVGDTYVYVCSSVREGYVAGFDICGLGIDADNSIVIDAK